MSSIVIGLATGYIVAWLMGMIDFSSVQSFGGVTIPHPFRFGLDISLSAVLSLALIFVITAIEAYGDITANSMISGEPVEGEVFIRRASGGIFADGFNSMISGMLCAFPNSVFAQNNGMIQLTGVASRYVGYYIAGLLILLGLFPAVGLVFSLMPEPVLGGATLLMFGGGCRHPHHCFAGDEPQDYAGHCGQFLVRIECGASSGDSLPAARYIA